MSEGTSSSEMEDGENNSEVEMDVTEESNAVQKTNERKVYLPGDPLQPGETLTCDESSYVMLHELNTGSPCLSFDIIQNPFVELSPSFPMTAYFIAGTQASETQANSIMVLKMSNLKRQKIESDSELSSSEDEDEDGYTEKRVFGCSRVKHYGCVNRIRAMVDQDVVLAASWSELGRVHIWNLSLHTRELDHRIKEEKQNLPLFTFKGHGIEGYGLDWCPTEKGVLASGDCKHGLHIWHPAEGGKWQVDLRSLVGHTKSVEDLQWSPNEANVLASCSVDKSIRIWDVRAPPIKANKLTVENAHETDVNVISWNKNEPLIVSGGDDGVIQIWDLRQFKSGQPVATFKHHTGPITSIEWNPTEESVFASGGEDNQIALWDIAVERDNVNEKELLDLPAELLFIHQGQTDIKELHWHPMYSGFCGTYHMESKVIQQPREK